MPSPLSRALLLATAALVGCKSDKPPANNAAAVPPAAASAATITVTATDFKLDLPATIPAGLVTLRLVNNGQEVHQAQLIRLDDGKTVADFEAAMKLAGPPPSWMKSAGGPTAAAPGQEASATQVLTPGQYVATCHIPSPDGVLHSMKGMVQPFEVTAGAAAAALPVAGDTVRLVDFAFEQSRPLTAGHHTILVENAGPQDHELVLLKLPPGKSVEDFGAWVAPGGMQGPPPAMPFGGLAVIAVGETAVLEVDLSPGAYGFICFVPDMKDGKMHFMHGMMKQITVE
jgi:hypothetical protein